MATYESDIKDHSRQIRTASSINAVLGGWLVISPWVYGFVATAGAMTWNNIIVGLAILACGWSRYRQPHVRVGLSWTNVALGAWTVLSPLVFNFTSDSRSMWNGLIIGLVVMALAIWSGTATVAEHHPHLT